MPATRVGERERFVREFFKHHGVQPAGESRGPFRVALTPTLKRRLRVQDFTCVFRAEDLETHPESELMVPGNPVFDRILALTRQFGAVSRRYLRMKRGTTIDAAAEALVRSNGRVVEAAARTPQYRSSFLFTFRVSYRSTESFDEIHSVMLSATSGKYLRGDTFFTGLNLMESAEPSIQDGETADAKDALPGALDALEGFITPTIETFVHESEAHLQRERARLQGFYTALIAEEKARIARRKRGGESVGAAERKLEWVNRLEQENRLFAPSVTVELIGLSEVRVPTCTVAVQASGKRLFEVELDLSTGEASGLACATCGSELTEVRVCDREHPTCAECMEECAECAR